MKLKLKLDQKMIQAFLLQNVEKIVLGAIVLVFLLMLYSSLTTAGRFDKTPEQLKAEVTKGRETITKTVADPKLVVADYVKQAKGSRVRIEEEPYRNLVSWDPELFETRALRGPPPLFTVQELRGTAGVGAFRTTPAAVLERAEPAARADRTDRADRGDRRQPPRPLLGTPRAAGGEDIRGQRWIVLTALVPIEKQEVAYAETFKQSPGYDAQNDYPMYLGYWVERMEVASVGEAANPDWTKATKFISSKAIDKATEDWASSRDTEIVAPEYFNKRLVFPLPPLVNRAWDASIVHEPQIPLEKIGERGEGLGGMRGPRIGGQRDRATPGPMGPMGPRGERGGGEGATDDTPFGAGEAAPEGTRGKRAAEVEPLPEEKKAPSYKLFRFFDFDVEPGKQYVYRVCLGLRNPNNGVKATYLKSPELAKDTYLKTKWSETSPVIPVPRDTRILASSVKPARPNSEPSAEILMVRWVQKKGVEVYKEFKSPPIMRGQVLNFPDQTGTPVSGGGGGGAAAPRPARGPMMGPRGIEGLGGLGGRGEPVPTFNATAGGTLKVDFTSDATAVDIRGGERLPGRRGTTLTATGEILILDSDGNLVVHDELDDTPAYEQIMAAGAAATADGGDRGFAPGLERGGPARPRGALDALQPATPARKKGAGP